MKFVQLILRKIIKIVATTCQILRLICTKFDFGWGSAPDPAGGAYSAPPDPLAGFQGPTSKGVEGREKGRGERGGERREEKGRGRKRGGEGRKGRGGEAFLVMWPRRLSVLNPPLSARVSLRRRHLCLLRCHFDFKRIVGQHCVPKRRRPFLIIP